MDIPYEPESLILSNSYKAENKSSQGYDEVKKAASIVDPIVSSSNDVECEKVKYDVENEKTKEESRKERIEVENLVDESTNDVSLLPVPENSQQKGEEKSNINYEMRTTTMKEENENKFKKLNDYAQPSSTSSGLAPEPSDSRLNADIKSSNDKNQREIKNNVYKTGKKENRNDILNSDNGLVKIALESWMSNGGSPSGVVMIDKITRQIKLSNITPGDYPTWISNKAKIDSEIYYGQDFFAEILAGLLDSDPDMKDKMRLSESLKNDIAQKINEALIVDSGARKRASIEFKTSLKARLGNIYSDIRLLELLMIEKSNDESDVLLWNTDITKMHEPCIKLRYVVPILAQNPYLRVATPYEQEFVRKAMLKRQRKFDRIREIGTEYDSTPTKNTSRLDVSNIGANNENEPKSKKARKETKPKIEKKNVSSKKKSKNKSKKEETVIDLPQLISETSKIMEGKKELNDPIQSSMEIEKKGQTKKKPQQTSISESPLPKKRAKIKYAQAKNKPNTPTPDVVGESSFPWSKLSNDPVILDNGTAVSPRQYQLYLVQLNAFDELARKAEGSGVQPPDFLKTIRSNGIPSYDVPSSVEPTESDPTPLSLNESPTKINKKKPKSSKSTKKSYISKKGKSNKSISSDSVKDEGGQSIVQTSNNDSNLDISHTDSTSEVKKKQPSKKATKKKKKNEWDNSDGDIGYGMPPTRSPSKASKSSVYTNEELLTSSYSVLARVCFVHIFLFILSKFTYVSLYVLQL